MGNPLENHIKNLKDGALFVENWVTRAQTVGTAKKTKINAPTDGQVK